MAGGYSNRVRATKFNPTGLIRKYPNVNHVLVRESTLPALKFEGETLPRMVREIISFLGTYL